ncbi:MAG: CadD family cadmium resistance transporter [Streptococcaceae bacterium]|jgi:cadmium resistance transport/sequestration family protein|nr:CadD family cadmium resistance transporter [Streptococcaceae bacterium]
MNIIIQSTVLYWATALDLLMVLALLYIKFDSTHHKAISLGQAIGSLLLVAISLLLAFVFHFVPEDWILGFLGIIPLYFGLKYLFVGDDDDEEVEEQLEKRKGKNLMLTVILISFASCGADNIGLFTPFFVTLSKTQVIISVITFLVNILILGLIGKQLSRIKWLHRWLGKYSRWILGVVYCALGILILFESGTVQKLLSFL